MRKAMHGIPVLGAIPILMAAVGLVLAPTARGAGAVLSPPHADVGYDVDSDELLDYLLVEVRLLVAEAGIFRLEGRGSWYPLAFTSDISPLQAGVQIVPLFFAGGLIRSSGVDGPYVIELTLYDETLDLLDVDTHTTHAYNHLDFEGPAAAFAPPHADYGLDTDGDGLFNYLVVEANLFISDAGTYSFSAEINWPSGPRVTESTRLEVGHQTVALRFDGRDFVSGRLDGPYAIHLNLWDSHPLIRVRDHDSYRTGPYNHLDFEEAEVGVAFAPPHADYGLDADGDEEFDRLVLAVNLEVFEAGSYTVEATLTLGARVSEASTTTSLPTGPGTVLLNLEGRHIHSSAVDGPYTVELTLGSRNSTHVTADYSHLDFEAPLVAFAPPHTDFGQDRDGNGLYDYLVVEATVNVTQAADYEVTGVLRLELPRSFCCPIWDFNATHLDVGIHRVSLRFSGDLINLSQVDGPFEVTLRIDAAAGMDTDSHVTADYRHLDFEGLAALLSPPHFDYGRDLDQDGLFDFLVVDVGIEVRREGTYRVAGLAFFRNGGLDSTGTVAELDVGFHRVRLWFYGHRANLSEADGPYSVSLSLARYQDEWIRLGVEDYRTLAYSHFDFEDPKSQSIESGVATVAPVIDGALEPGEWDDALYVDLSQTVGNMVPGSLLVKNDDEFLYVALDATGDVSEDTTDTARVAFDTGNDEAQTEGGEDEFVQGGQAPRGQAHYVRGPLSWRQDDAPYDTDLPGHRGLASARGFGPSDGSPVAHRVYEFAIPLPLLGLVPGETVGFLIGGHSPSLALTPGIWDAASGRSSSWPVGRHWGVSLSEYAELTLADLRPTVAIFAPIDASFVASNDISVSWSANDVGTGIDHFQLRLDDGTPLHLVATARGYQFRDLVDGPHRVEVTVFDGAGHSRVDVVDFTVDTTPPTVSIPIAARHLVFHVRDLTVFFTVEDLTSGLDRIEVSLDGGMPEVFPTNATGYLLTDLADGPHTVTVSATDRAGNVGSASAAFTIDTNPFSPTGPFGPGPLLSTLLVAAVSIAALFFLRRRMRMRRTRESPP